MSSNGKSVLVTGAAGFIGSHLTEKLLNLGHSVTGIDNFTRGKKEHIEHLSGNPNFSFHNADIRNLEDIKDLFKGQDYVYHEAAVCINKSQKHPEEAYSINVVGSHNVLQSALDANVKKLIYASSASVYGNPLYVPMDESHPFNPLTPYCVSKIALENQAKMFLRKGLDSIALRYFNVYGKRQAVDAFYTSVIVNWIRMLSKNEQPVIHNDGKQTMDFVHVSDVVDANMLFLGNDIKNDVFNVASSVETPLNTLYTLVAKYCGKDIKPKYVDMGFRGVRRRQAGIAKLCALGWQPKVALEDGIKDLVEHYLSDPEYYSSNETYVNE